MKHLVVIALSAILLAAPAFAGLPSHPGQGRSVFASGRVCKVTQFATRPVPKGTVSVDVTINGHHVSGYMVTRNAVEWSGYGVIVRIIEQPRRSAPLIVRAASIRFDCARVNVLASWR